MLVVSVSGSYRKMTLQCSRWMNSGSKKADEFTRTVANITYIFPTDADPDGG